GNVRELRNVIQRYALLEVRDAEALFGSTRGDKGEDLSLLPFHEARRIAMERFERAYFPKVLARAGGVVSRAAQLAEVARPSFYRMLERVRESQS
ncbi:MAG: AAA family ATPase, partial [Polyangiales bacterium]